MLLMLTPLHTSSSHCPSCCYCCLCQQVVAETIACELETMVNGRNTSPGLDLSAVPTALQSFAVAL
jgi:hypothetical protein